ncbi:MAG: diguanylate cyclase [Methylococcales bacterium]|nr:diguanylate cyclase [Methylococcales bacterium]
MEAHETWIKEHIRLDALTQLLAKESMLTRLKEKVENSRLNGFPFSIVLISLKDFDSRNQLLDYELDAVLRNVADHIKAEIRGGIDIAARMDKQEFLIALPGSSLQKANSIAAQFKQDILEQIKAPRDLVVQVAVGAAEYVAQHAEFGSNPVALVQDVDALLRIATQNKH